VIDLDRLSKREAYEEGFADGRGSVDLIRSGILSTEFWIIGATTFFAMAVGGYAVLHPEIELERVLGVLAAVVAVAWRYTTSRTDLKKTAAEAGTTTIKTPAASLASADALVAARSNGQRWTGR
jgi:hypothetical protein